MITNEVWIRSGRKIYSPGPAVGTQKNLQHVIRKIFTCS